MWQKIIDLMADELDNILYFFMALMLIILGMVVAKWINSPDWITNMITMLFGACLIKVKGGDTVSKIAGALRDVAGTGANKSPLGKIVGGVKDIID